MSTVYAFPAATRIESLAIRSNGQILATQGNTPHVWLVDRDAGNSEALLLHKFDDTASISGITEGYPDVFYVSSANDSSNTLKSYGEGYIYKINMTQYRPNVPAAAATVSKVVTIPEAQALNGLVYFSGSREVLFAADSHVGGIWRIDLDTGKVDLAINNIYTQSTGSGVNSLRYKDGFLYFTNSQQGTLVKVVIDNNGDPAGRYKVLARGGFVPNDFALDVRGNAYVASLHNATAKDTDKNDGISFVPASGGPVEYVAEVAGPTSAAFGRTASDCNVLYVSTSGGDNMYLTDVPMTVSGKIVKIDLGEWSPNCVSWEE